MNSFTDSDDSKIKLKKIKRMQLRVDVHWCLILSGFDCYTMIFSIRSGHVDPEAWTFSAFWLLNSYLVGLSPIRCDES